MMLSLLLAASLIALALLAKALGRWRQRAEDARKAIDADRKAHEIQNKVALDPDYRERVRRTFDGS